MPFRRESRPGPVLELALGGQPESEWLVRDLTATLGSWVGFKPARVEDLKTAVCEAFLNAVEHGNAGQLDEPVRVAFWSEPDQLVVVVTDGGQQDLPADPPRPGHPDRVRGWGLFFMRELMDTVDWRRLPDGTNEVRMIMRRETANAGIG